MSNTEETQYPATAEALRERITELEAAIYEQSRDNQEERGQLIEAHRERMDTRLERWQAQVNEQQERIDALLATDQGKAWAEVEDMKRQMARTEERATRADGRAIQAESDRDRALASVADGENIHPADPRVAHIWRKASRIATTKGYCSEYDHIADALGLPELEFAYEGSVTVNITAWVTVPVSGTATRQQIADGEVDYDIDESVILDSLESDTISWEIDQIEIEAQDNEED